MMNSSVTVSAELGLSLVVPEHGSIPLVASLHYSADDPYAIRMAFHVGTDEPVEWIFARDLLAVGLGGPAGEGDVQVWPADEQGHELLNIALSSPFRRGSSLRGSPRLDFRVPDPDLRGHRSRARERLHRRRHRTGRSALARITPNAREYGHALIRHGHFTDRVIRPPALRILRRLFY
jgi:hypothetical protein